MARPTLTYLNLVNLNYYPFLITLDEYNGSCNVGDDLSMKIRVSGKKDLNLTVFNVITSKKNT